MAEVQQISEITPSFAFTEFDFYKDYEESFKKSELGRFHALLPLREMAVRFGLIDSAPQGKVGRKVAIRTSNRPWQGGKEGRVWSQVQQHHG